MHNPIIAIVAAALAAWIFGAIWYGVLGKVWQRAQGLDPEACKGQKMPLAPMAVSFVSELVMALFFFEVLRGALSMQQFDSWQEQAGFGTMLGLLAGIGLMATTTLVNNMFRQSKLMLSVIDGAHWIGVAVIECVVLSALLFNN